MSSNTFGNKNNTSSRINGIEITKINSISYLDRDPDPLVWEYYADNRYYDKTKITQLNNVISVWTYRIVTNDLRQEAIDDYQGKNDLERANKYRSLDHFISLVEIDCKNKMMRLKRFISYNDKEQMLDDHSYDPAWETIAPNTVDDILYQKLCPSKEQPTKKWYQSLF